MQNVTAIKRLEMIYQKVAPRMDERTRRLWAAAEAQAYGWGGIQAVGTATGLAANTIRRGLGELRDQEANFSRVASARVRKAGGGRKRQTERDPDLRGALERLIEPTTRGDPQSPLRWVCKSTARLASELTAQGHPVSARTIGRLLALMGYSLQANRKTQEGTDHPDRNAQFEHINVMVQDFQHRGQPVISVDTKKKELIGNFRQMGQEWEPKGRPVEVLIHDFVDSALGKAIPYGVYDLTQNAGWVSVGIDHDTARFAAQAIQRWWLMMGARDYPHARRLLITADGGGSNGSRCRLWKVALQEVATTFGLPISVCHFPPGASKWNKIEHRMFCHITQNWRGRPLVSLDVMIRLITATSTRHGLKINAELDPAHYPTGIKISDDELAAINLKPADFHGDWNYQIWPKC